MFDLRDNRKSRSPSFKVATGQTVTQGDMVVVTAALGGATVARGTTQGLYIAAQSGVADDIILVNRVYPGEVVNADVDGSIGVAHIGKSVAFSGNDKVALTVGTDAFIEAVNGTRAEIILL